MHVKTLCWTMVQSSDEALRASQMAGNRRTRRSQLHKWRDADPDPSARSIDYAIGEVSAIENSAGCIHLGELRLLEVRSGEVPLSHESTRKVVTASLGLQHLALAQVIQRVSRGVRLPHRRRYELAAFLVGSINWREFELLRVAIS